MRDHAHHALDGMHTLVAFAFYVHTRATGALVAERKSSRSLWKSIELPAPCLFARPGEYDIIQYNITRLYDMIVVYTCIMYNIYIYICVHIILYVYVYIYNTYDREKEIQRERERQI